MPRIIMKSPYIKPNSKTHIGNYVSYIATRDGVDKADSTQKFMEATERQKHIIKKFLIILTQRTCMSIRIILISQTEVMLMNLFCGLPKPTLNYSVTEKNM